MVSDEVYELCLPILRDSTLPEEDKTDKLEDLLGKENSLKGTSLENAVLDVLWRFRDAAAPSSSPGLSRHTVLRRPSPALWQNLGSASPSASPKLASSTPARPSSLSANRPPFQRALSATASPYHSPGPSPRPAFAAPSITSHDFTPQGSVTPEANSDYGGDAADWSVGDDTASNSSSNYGSPGYDDPWLSGSNAFMQPKQVDMSPHDMLRSVLGEGRSDEDIEKALELNNYDLSATVMTLMDSQGQPDSETAGFHSNQGSSVLIGKSMSPPRVQAPSGQPKNSIVCKFWLSTGSCLRADCKFSHDLSNHICKYWMMGSCLAGDTCIFSHDPSSLMSRMEISDFDPSGQSSPGHLSTTPDYDFDSYPSLSPSPRPSRSQLQIHPRDSRGGRNSGFRGQGSRLRRSSPFRSRSRPQSRQDSRDPNIGSFKDDDQDPFPSLGSSAKSSNKKAGHGNPRKPSKESVPNSLAEVVQMSPSPGAAQLRKGAKAANAHATNGENSAAAQKIPAPVRIPWLETGENANKAYMKARQEAIKHGSQRNKFLQSAAQAWNRNDTRAAKALSLRGQSENDLMRKAHREAAQMLYEERNKHGGSKHEETFIDLHGLHPDEAVSYLWNILTEQQYSGKPIYAIVGTGHHSKGGRDKLGKSIRGFLNEWRYAFREFSVTGDRNSSGGILGIDPASYDKSLNYSENTEPTARALEEASYLPVNSKVSVGSYLTEALE